MKQTVTKYDFERAFMDVRPDSFSYEGLGLLYDHIEQLDEDCGTETELDVIAICCDFNEDHMDDIIDQYDIDVSDCEDDEDRLEAVKDHIEYHSFLVGVLSDCETIIYQVW